MRNDQNRSLVVAAAADDDVSRRLSPRLPRSSDGRIKSGQGDSRVEQFCRFPLTGQGVGYPSCLPRSTPLFKSIFGRAGVERGGRVQFYANETETAKGVKAKILGEGPAMIPGYKTVRLRDISYQPGSSSPANAMKNPMVCHVTEGELQVTQDNGKTFAAKKNTVWTCNTGTTEGVANSGSVVAVMRITDLLTG
jgi:hypothetical protein